MIDIHSHIIFGVDDGAKTIDESISLIKIEIENGVTDIICTPHYRKGMFEAQSNLIEENFNKLVEEIKKLNLPINLYLGREIYYNEKVLDKIKNKQLYSLNNSNKYLIEYSYTSNTEIDEHVYNFSRFGYQMVIAHIERYEYITSLDYVYELKELGALIQVNASTICGKNGHKQYKKVMNYIRNGLVDFVASDIHFSRINYMKDAYNIIKKKCGIEIAEKLFNSNAKILIK